MYLISRGGMIKRMGQLRIECYLELLVTSLALQSRGPLGLFILIKTNHTALHRTPSRNIQ